MTSQFSIEGKTAIVTGAGQGIGLAIAETLAKAGANIVIADLNSDTGTNAVEHIQSLGRQAIFVAVDVADPVSVDAMVAHAIEHFGRVDILVNNAGIVKNTSALKTSDDEWRKIIDVNVNGVFGVAVLLPNICLNVEVAQSSISRRCLASSLINPNHRLPTMFQRQESL